MNNYSLRNKPDGVTRMNGFFCGTAAICLIAFFIPNADCDTSYRLDINLEPIKYYITLTPYFNTSDEKAFTFDGEVIIEFRTQAPNIKQIKLHSEDLEFNETNITLESIGAGSVNLATQDALKFESKYTFANINLQDALQNDTEYNLTIRYTSKIRTDLVGFYRSHYEEKGVIKWLGATQMESTHARKVFPCFDEPRFKSTFILTIDRPENYKPSLSNTNIMTTDILKNGYVRETFHPTPRMSTYLLAFLVSEFEPAQQSIINSHEFGIYTRPEAINQSAFAFDFGQRVEKALSEYFNIDYYSMNSNLRLDHVALPDFRAGAMENWGLINYREAYLLYVPEVTTPDYKYKIAQIIAHETTHMWFGDLVTCHWWGDTWLNEGFANYFQDYITSMIEPEVGSGNILVTGSLYDAYDADELPDVPAISNDNINSPSEISNHFGAFSYQKAGAVIRMMHHLMGDEAFRRGLHIYLDGNKFDVGTPDKLYESLDSKIVPLSGSTDYSGLSITEVMKSWISQPGHPVLRVEVDYTTGLVTLSQKRFYIDPSHVSNQTYHIPITYTTGVSLDFTDTTPAFVMANESHILNVSEIRDHHSWIIFNIQETGVYRVNYDDHSWQMIATALKGNMSKEIHNLNRAKIVNDLFAFLYADEVDMKIVHEVLQFLKQETDYSVWYAAIRGLNNLRNFYLGTNTIEVLDAYSLDIMENIVVNLGYAVRTTDDLVTQRNRLQILNFACKLGHQECIKNVVALFKGLKENGTEISPSLRPVAYCNGLRHGNGEDFDFLWQRMSTTNVANEARIITDSLGCSSDENKLKSFLLSVVEESPIRSQDSDLPLLSVLADYNNVHIVMEQLQQNYTLWSSTHTSMEDVLTKLPSYLHTEDEFTQFTQFLSSCTECDVETMEKAKVALNKARENTGWAKNHQADIVSVFGRNHSMLARSSFILLIAVFISHIMFL